MFLVVTFVALRRFANGGNGKVFELLSFRSEWLWFSSELLQFLMHGDAVVDMFLGKRGSKEPLHLCQRSNAL